MKFYPLIICLACTTFAVCLTFPVAAGILHEASPAQSSPQKVKLMQARKQAAEVKRGTTRVKIEKLYPNKDAGVLRSDLTRYYLGDEVMVDVPFDKQGGEGGQQNSVNGPLRVYLSPPHSN